MTIREHLVRYFQGAPQDIFPPALVDDLFIRAAGTPIAEWPTVEKGLEVWRACAVLEQHPCFSEGERSQYRAMQEQAVVFHDSVQNRDPDAIKLLATHIFPFITLHREPVLKWEYSPEASLDEDKTVNLCERLQTTVHPVGPKALYYRVEPKLPESPQWESFLEWLLWRYEVGFGGLFDPWDTLLDL